jgi:tRNA threonylcarbamoyladenosine modification (KEOPS) complex Cgi121 subunit
MLSNSTSVDVEGEQLRSVAGVRQITGSLNYFIVLISPQIPRV